LPQYKYLKYEIIPPFLSNKFVAHSLLYLFTTYVKLAYPKNNGTFANPSYKAFKSFPSIALYKLFLTTET